MREIHLLYLSLRTKKETAVKSRTCVPGGDVLLQVTASKGEVTQRAFLAVLSLLTQDLIPSPCIILAALLIHLVAFLSVSHPPLLVDLVAVSLVPSFVVHGVSLILSQHFLSSSHESISTSSSVPVSPLRKHTLRFMDPVDMLWSLFVLKTQFPPLSKSNSTSLPSNRSVYSFNGSPP